MGRIRTRAVDQRRTPSRPGGPLLRGSRPREPSGFRPRRRTGGQDSPTTLAQATTRWTSTADAEWSEAPSREPPVCRAPTTRSSPPPTTCLAVSRPTTTPPPRGTTSPSLFLDKLTVHIAKNFMELPKIKVPLILGVWGGKGQGKTFQTHLAFQKLGVNPIVMSAGELESGNAGEPAKLVRQRYREASDVIKKGKMCSLFINDLDAGAGRMGGTTQYTVNNQMVNATLMNIADNPTNVQLPGTYNNEEIPRVPIICTGNDFSTLYAPLIRDGRMEKFYWSPTREDRIGICTGIFKDDDIGEVAIERLMDSFPNQSIDFFGALRARIYDDLVRGFIGDTGLENLSARLVNSREGPPKFTPPQMDVESLMKYGNLLVEEQENVKRVQLADAYLDGAELAGESGSSLPEEVSA